MQVETDGCGMLLGGVCEGLRAAADANVGLRGFGSSCRGLHVEQMYTSDPTLPSPAWMMQSAWTNLQNKIVLLFSLHHCQNKSIF